MHPTTKEANMPDYQNEIYDEYGETRGIGIFFTIFGLFVFGITPMAELNWLARIYLFGGLITFILRLKRNKAEFYKELGCAFKSHGSNFWTTLIFWPFELLALAFGCKCSFIRNYRFTEFRRIMHNRRGIHNDTASEMVDEKIERGGKEAERFVNDAVYQARKTTAVVGSGAMITLSNYAFAKGTPPKANEEVAFQMIVWGDVTYDRQLWMKLKLWNFEVWQQNRWPTAKGLPTSYIGGGLKLPLFAKSAIVVNCGPQISDQKTSSFAFFVNLIIGFGDWQIVLANRAQKNLPEAMPPWVLLHVQSLKTPLVSWLRLKADQAYLLEEPIRVRIGPEFSFPALKHFRVWPNYDFIREVLDVQLQFQYTF